MYAYEAALFVFLRHGGWRLWEVEEEEEGRAENPAVDLMGMPGSHGVINAFHFNYFCSTLLLTIISR